MKFTNLLLLLIFILFSACRYSSEHDESKTSETPHLGEIEFLATGSQEAQPYFKNGILLLHSFEYEDAREQFLKAQELDSTFAMAYWGEAMTYNHSLWQRQDKEKAVAALDKLASSPEIRKSHLNTELEKDFFSAVEILFGEGTKYDRDLEYSEFLQGLMDKYPDNHEVAAFYAISLLGSSRNGRNEELYDHSARIAQGIIKENPNHPGALHYLIHSYDDPEHAHLASAAADSYAKVAPDATHALHMPSHIYVALGSWDKVVNSNIASWNASVKRIKKKGIEDQVGSFHALNWLQYGLLQRGEFEQATVLLKNMIGYTNDNPHRGARSYLVSMKGGHMVETNTWEGEFSELEIDIEDLNLVTRAGYAFLDGLKAYHSNKPDLLSEVLDGINKERIKAEITIGDSGFAMCSSGGFANKPPNQLDVDMVRVMELELLAYQSHLKGNTDQAKSYFEKAVDLDKRLSYSFGPPDIFKPAPEAYGEWLLEISEPREALKIFEKSLDRNPRRLLSLQGLKRAAQIINNETIIAEVTSELEESLSKKDRTQIL